MYKIVFCLPANEYKRAFFDSWLNLSIFLNKVGYEFVVSTAGGSNISKVRESCVRPFRAGSVHPKKPFYGEINYSHIMWIDSDIVFTPQNFKNLFNRNVDLVSGLYYAADGNFACEIKTEIPPNKDGLVEAKWAGMGFMLMKRGVLESIEPPWFPTAVIDGQFLTEDIHFCYMAQKAGYKLFVDPEVVVGHIKEQQLGYS